MTPLLDPTQRAIVARSLSDLIEQLKDHGIPVMALVVGIVLDPAAPDEGCGLHAVCITDGVLRADNGSTSMVDLVRDVGRLLASEPAYATTEGLKRPS